MVRTTPDHDYEVKLLADVEQHGCHLVAFQDDPEGPAYVFSVGVSHTLATPEDCILGLSDTKPDGIDSEWDWRPDAISGRIQGLARKLEYS